MGTPHGSVRADQAARDHPTASDRIRAAGGTRAVPAPGIGHPAGDSPRLGWDMGPWLGRAGLWGARCGITGWGLMALGADMGSWPRWGEAQQVHTVGSEEHNCPWGTGTASVNKKLCRIAKRPLSF